MILFNKTRVSFHYGNAFSAAGIDKKPFAVLQYDGIVDRELIDKICQLVREHVNETEADFCNVKISTEDWDS
jgi:hypothetical protein